MRRLFLATWLVLLCRCALSAEPLASFEATERLGLDWRRTLVTYAVKFGPARAWPGKVRLADEQGREHACQLWRVKSHGDGSIASARLSFMAELKKGASYSYRLLPGRPALAKSKCKAYRDGSYLTLENGIVAIRLPKEGPHEFEKPLTFGKSHSRMLRLYGKQVENGIAPGPIQGIRLVDGRWVGGSYFRAAKPEQAPKVTQYASEVTEQGALFVEAAVRYRFDNDGFYRMTARVMADDPAVRIDEQFDPRRTGSGATWRLVVSLTGGWQADGWKPDHVFWQSPEGRVKGRAASFEARLAQLGFETKPFAGRRFGSRKLQFERPLEKVLDLAVWYPWHPAVHHFGLVDSAMLQSATSRGFRNPREDKEVGDDVLAEEKARRDAARRKRIPFLAVVPIHAGNWRSAHQTFRTTTLFTHKADDVALHWPLLAEPHPNTLLHTGEYDPTLPLTFCRRQWALVAGPLQFHDTLHPFRAQEGYVNLDDYKEWILDWPVDPKVTYPRLVFTLPQVRNLREDKAQLAGHPGADILRKFLYFNEDDPRREELWRGLTSKSCWSGPRGQAVAGLGAGGDARRATWVTSYRQTQMAGWAGNMDELLASPRLTDAQRRRLRSDLAALCHLLSEPDFNPRGSMIHLGNPNMPINRLLGLAFAAALIPDHPMANEWLDVAAKYLRFKLAMNTAPGGTWSELLTYFGASAPHVMQAATVLDRTGRLDDATARLAAMPAKFTIHLLSPKDPRFGARTTPNWGHEGYDLCTHWLVAAGLMRDRNPDLAKALVWAWDQTGRPMEQHHDAGFSERVILHADLLRELKPGYVPKELESTWLPGFGAVLRAHPGDPNETFLAYRQGYLVSHCDANQGDFILYAKGAPLSTLSLFGYAIHDDRRFARLNREFGWHNRVRFGSTRDTGGWPGGGPISQVHAHFFSPSVDYLRGMGDYGPQRWTRQILFLKGKTARGPNYFVFRDSFHSLDGDPKKLQPTWWYLRTPGKKERVSVSKHGLTYTSPFGPKLYVHFLQPATVQAETRDATQRGPMYNRAAINWQKARSPVVQGSSTSIRVEETISVTAVGPIAAGQDVLVVLYPLAPDEKPPGCERLADGVVKISTSESTDYVFVHREFRTSKQDDVTFAGVAGAVRVYPKELHLVTAGGPGKATCKGVGLRSGTPSCWTGSITAADSGRVIKPPSPKHRIRFAVSRPVRKTQNVQAGVLREELDDGFAYTFESREPLDFRKDGITFAGYRGGIVVDTEKKTVRLVLVEGERIGCGRLMAWGCDGPFEVTFHRDRITGRTDGLGRFLYLSMPEGLDRLPMLVLDGQTYAPGTSGRTLIVPVMPGEHRFTIRALEQPPICRNWQAEPASSPNTTN